MILVLYLELTKEEEEAYEKNSEEPGLTDEMILRILLRRQESKAELFLDVVIEPD